jgi:transposase
LSASEANSAQVVEFYKKLANVEEVFRFFENIDINVRPVRHYLENRVRAHMFLYVLSTYLLRIAKEKLAPLAFRATEKPRPTSPVAKKVISDSGKAKAATKINNEGEEVTPLRTLLHELDTITRSICRIKEIEVTFK